MVPIRKENLLAWGELPLLRGLPESVDVQADLSGVGVFLSIAQTKSAARLALPVGRPEVARWVACFRYEPFWMKPQVGDGNQIAAIPRETQSLLAELPGGQVALIIPLLDGAFRCALEGGPDGQLLLVAESLDPAVVTRQVCGLFVAAGDDLYTLLEQAAAAIAAHLKMGRLRKDKSLPALADDFGWCTWDAFYQEVSHEKIRAGLQSFKAGGIEPRTLILDDGWQSVGPPEGDSAPRLTAFAANEKFPGDLTPTVAMAKQEFAIKTFLVWHALQGYWGGVDPERFADFDAHAVPRNFGEGILEHFPDANSKYWGAHAGIIPARHIHRFFHDYHRHLRLQGVDGVKVDNQSTTEGLARGEGGRVALLRTCREALEGSAHTHFAGRLINCMSCGNDILYQTLNSTLTRTSTDFWPKRPETHGLHLCTNAQVGLWFGNFVHPDWDMFQSGHAWGAFHAAGRAVSGAPVYVSDQPGEQNFELLRKLVCSDGSVLRCASPGLPTRDCIFADPCTDNVLLKIFNRVGDLRSGGGGGGVIGVFHCSYEADPARQRKISGTVSPADIPNLPGEDFLLYLHNADTIELIGRDDAVPLTLTQGEWEIATIVPIDADGFAPLGLMDKLNTGQAVMRVERRSATAVRVQLRDGGKFAAYCEHPPTHLHADARKLVIHYADGLLKANIPVTGRPVLLTIEW